MTHYQIIWITPSLAVGYAPMSFAELDSIKAHGIDAILNLCGEFCDLHEIEEKTGFEVYFLPIPDENAPDMEEMELALEWLDEALYLGKKVLVHCRHGIGRTGTVVSAYLIRRGLGLKVASKKMKRTRANPTNYAQWRLLKRYSKKVGKLIIREPALENQDIVDLTTYFAEYEALTQEVEEQIAAAEKSVGKIPRCGRETDSCCQASFDLRLIEAIFLLNKMNKNLSCEERKEAINRAVEASQKARATGQNNSGADYVCPLSMAGRCILYKFRPIRCRCYGCPGKFLDLGMVEDCLAKISHNLFFALSGTLPGKEKLRFSCPDTASGRFVQVYFHYLASL